MKKVIKADGQINFVNEKYLDSVLEDTDTVDEDYVVDRTPPTKIKEEQLMDIYKGEDSSTTSSSVKPAP